MAYLSQYDPHPIFLWFSYSSLLISTPASLIFPYFSVHVLAAPFRTSFPNAHINLLSLSSGHCSNAVLSIIAYTPTSNCYSLLLYKLFFFFFPMALITIWHNVGLFDYLFIIYFLTKCKILESWNLFCLTAWSHCLK